MENFSYLFAAYTIIFAVIFLYVIFMQRRQARLETSLRALEARLTALRGELAARPDTTTRPAPLIAS